MKAAYHPDEVIATVAAARGQYITIFLSVLVVTYGFFLVIDFVPEAPDETTSSDTTGTAGGTEVAYAAEESPAPVAVVATSSEATGSQQEDEAEESAPVNEDPVPAVTPTVSSEPVTATEPVDPEPTVADVAQPTPSALPVRIEIDALDRVVPVLNPTSRDVNDLDTALLSGVVRHPDAANFNQEGNMFILGHSSRLPNVINQNFQAFNDIETLEWGDTIRVYSTDTVYVYRVDRVYEAKASTASVPIAGTGKMLTLATCNSFGSVDDRHIVEAKLISEQAL